MFFKAPDQYITEGQPFTIAGTQFPANWLNLATPEDKTALGLVEVVTVGTREDDKYFWVSETLECATRTIVNTPKDPEQIAAMVKAEKQAEIDRLERDAMLPRPVREYMLLDIETKAVAAGYTLEQLRAEHHGYRKTKEFDEAITALRSAL